MRRKITPLEEVIWNNGERLIFGVSHCIEEDIRHRSSYMFFKKIIENDLDLLQSNGIETTLVRIIDLGCGVGHGCQTLAEIRNSIVAGVDICEATLEYAQLNYVNDNIVYEHVDLVNFIPNMPEFDYVVSL